MNETNKCCNNGIYIDTIYIKVNYAKYFYAQCTKCEKKILKYAKEWYRVDNDYIWYDQIILYGGCLEVFIISNNPF